MPHAAWQNQSKKYGEYPLFFNVEEEAFPIVSHMQKALGVESVLSGFSLPEDNIHSPNEHLDLDVFYKGIDTIVDYIFRIGDRCKQVSHDS